MLLNSGRGPKGELFAYEEETLLRGILDQASSYCCWSFFNDSFNIWTAFYNASTLFEATIQTI